MNPSVIVIVALFFVVAFGSVFNVSIGILSLSVALLIGRFAFDLGYVDILSGFPLSMFGTLVGTTVLFGIAKRNGTLGVIIERLVPSYRNFRLIPIIFFLLALVLSAIGAGNIVATALLAPTAMGLAVRLGISPAIMALMVANGANAGSLSPLSSAGIITIHKLDEMGIVAEPGKLFFLNMLANVAVAALAFVVFRGWRIFSAPVASPSPHKTQLVQIDNRHLATAGIIVAILLLAATTKVQLGVLAACGVLMLTRFSPTRLFRAMRDVPWETIIMVCGVTTLVALFETTNGINQLVQFVVESTSPTTIFGLIALVAGVLSVFSSSSGVVLPTMLPLIPGIIAAMPVVSATSLAAAIVIGSHIVDVSPFSTLGALCIAALPDKRGRQKLQPVLAAWGIGIAFVGGVLCHLIFGVLRVGG